MTSKEESIEINAAANTAIITSQNSSSEDAEQENATSTESEETTSAESAPAETVRNVENTHPADIPANNTEEGTKVNDKDENKENKETVVKDQHQSEDDDSDDDEEAVLESSPCGRWHKRKETVRI